MVQPIASDNRRGGGGGMSRTPEQMGKDIFRKTKSPFVSKETVLTWLESAKQELCQRLENSFYRTEMEDRLPKKLRKDSTK